MIKIENTIIELLYEGLGAAAKYTILGLRTKISNYLLLNT